jgi:DNA invertase Pin-like site-specific DNA recombinase
MVKAILYAAKSTEDKRGSIPTQLEDCRAMAEREGWEVDAEYQDEAASAWSGDRGPGLAEAMEHAERVAPSMLVVQHSDRLARGDARQARHLVEVVTWAVKAGVTIRSVQDDLFADERLSVLMGALMGQRNTEDSRRKSLAVKAGLKRRAKHGLYTGGRPYGYRSDDGKIHPLDAEAVVVRRVFEEFVAGRSMVAIARGLHSDDIRTATGKPSSAWRQATVGGILRRELYTGGEHEAIIDADTWKRACALLAARPSKGKGRPPIGRHLFKGGMLRCGECGEAMVPRTKRKPHQEYYCCNGHISHGDGYCTQGCIQRSTIDSATFNYFEHAGIDIEATKQVVKESRDLKLAEVRALRKQAQREAQLAAGRLARVRRDYQDGALLREDWAEQREQLTGERDAAQAEVDRLRAHETGIVQDGDELDAEKEVLDQLVTIRKAIVGEVNDAQGLEAVRAALARLFVSFTIYTRGDPLEIDMEGKPVGRRGSRGKDLAIVPIPRPDAERIALSQAPKKYTKASGCL